MLSQSSTTANLLPQSFCVPNVAVRLSSPAQAATVSMVQGRSPCATSAACQKASPLKSPAKQASCEAQQTCTGSDCNLCAGPLSLCNECGLQEGQQSKPAKRASTQAGPTVQTRRARASTAQVRVIMLACSARVRSWWAACSCDESVLTDKQGRPVSR